MQEDVFTEVEPMLGFTLGRHNACVLAYGQTGTGKTFSMEGTAEQPGIVIQVLEKLFELDDQDFQSNVTFSISMLEVYMGSLRDLLVIPTHENAARCSNLNIRTGHKGQIQIDGLTDVLIPDLPKAKRWYNRGRQAPLTSWTNVNEISSRSHCLTRISIVRRRERDGKAELSKLWMVDLGGSERLLKSGVIGLTLDEGRAINLSLSALGDVVAALRRKRRHVPYRNSKLTQILKDSLGDDSKVLMLVHVSPREEDLAETTYSLSFAKRARAVERTEKSPVDSRKLVELEEIMRETKEECRTVGTQLTKAESLLSESKKLLLASRHPLDDQTEPVTTFSKKQSAKSFEVVAKSPKTILRPLSLPRFMNSTAASRERLITRGQQITKRSKKP